MPAKEMTGKVLQKMTTNHKFYRLFHFCSMDMCFSLALSPCVKNTDISQIYCKIIIIYTNMFGQTVPTKIRLLQIDAVKCGSTLLMNYA